MTGNDTTKTYWLADTIWYAPSNVIVHFGAHLSPLPPEQKKTKEFRKAEEMLASAFSLIGMQHATKERFWIQPVPDTERSPDVRTGHAGKRIEGQPRLFETQDVEIVGFMPNQYEDIAAFLRRTKLCPDKAYDAKTTILCHLQTGASVPSLPAITDALRGGNAVCPVFILGRTSKDKNDFILFQVHPQFAVIAEYNVEQELLKQKHSGALNLRRGTSDDEHKRPCEQHCPFESLGFECPLLTPTSRKAKEN